ncbi:MAG: ImmA/IrrE family metallo-endopeptidase [Lachnospiraceae bacterium]|nr:ImmA/IrrE family metallo-endopeptidase [Lachnospiraceae bacterium]
MQVNISVSSEILDWVITHIQADTLPNQIVDYLNLWISGEKKPTFNQVERVSKATGIPLGYFFLQTPPQEDLSIVEYRTIDSIELKNPSRNLIDTLHDMDQVQAWMHDYLISEGNGPLAFVGSLKTESSFEVFAGKVRDLLGISADWYRKVRTVEECFNVIRTAISNAGAVVMMSGIVGTNTHRPLDVEEFRAFSVVDSYAPLIFINANDSINGRLFSLLHEFSHICIGENSLFNDRYSAGKKVKKVETICNAVAAEILVPQAFFVKGWNAVLKENDVEQTIEILAREFKCGITVIARKAFDNGFIDYQLYHVIAQRAVKLYNDSRKRKKEQGEGGGDFYRTAASRIDKRFFALLVNSVQEGKTLYSDAYRLTNTNRSTFTNLAGSVGGGAK